MSFRLPALIQIRFQMGLVILGSLLVFAPPQAAAPVPNRDFVPALWVVESKGLVKIDAATGAVLLDIPVADKPRVVAVDERAGMVWTYGHAVLQSYRFSGTLLIRLPVPGKPTSSADDDHDEEDPNEDDGEEEEEAHLALTVDPADSAVWLGRGKTLFRFNAGGVLQFNVTLPQAVRAQSLDTAHQVLWVATKKNLLAYDSRGTKIGAIPSGQEADIQDLTFDASIDSLWVATKKHLRRYSTAGTLQFERSFHKINRLASDGHGGLWVATEKALSLLDVSGLVRFTVSPFQGQGEGKILDVAADPADRSAWVMTGRALSHVDAEGRLLQALNFREKGEGHDRLQALAIYSDVVAPTLTVMTPVSGSFINTTGPTLRLSYGDIGIGVDTGTLTATANESALTLACDFEAETATCLPSTPFAEGTVSLRFTVKDFAGNLSDAANTRFTVDTVPPTMTVTEPAEGLVTRQAVQLIKGQVSEVAELRVNNTVVPLQSENVFAHFVSLSEGVNTISLAARDLAGNASAHTLHLTLDTAPPAAANVGLITVSPVTNGTATVTGSAGSVESRSRVRVTNLRTALANTASADTAGAFSASITAQGNDQLNIVVLDAAGNESVATTVTVPTSGVVAPPLDPTVATTLVSATAFLYTGPNPIQTGMSAGTIDPKRIVVLRGKALTRDSQALSDVTITIHGHPEYGQTLTRADGMFDLAVNGGGYLTINYAKAGYLPVQRQVHTPWNDYVIAPDVALIVLDPQVTTIDLTAPTMQSAQGSPVIDSDGTRQATLLFTPGTTASMLLPNGTTQSLATLHVRATEYTVGPNGPKAMPATLPPASGYTYAVELSVDEALAVNAKRVTFNKPVIHYVENFLNFPVGGIVPTGYYDRDKAAWIPSDNGRVIQILSTAGGIAALDTNGDGHADDATPLATLNITDAERVQLAALYPSNTSLWRVPIPHFTPWDCNWPYGPSADANPPQQPDPIDDAIEDDPDCQGGSIIECQNQILGESIRITGTPLRLNYRSNRVPGRKTAYRLTIPLSGTSVPTSLKRIELEVKIAGRRFMQTFSGAPNQNTTFIWDGQDAYGRTVQGQQSAQVRIGYAYDVVYQKPGEFQQSFDRLSGVPISGFIRGRSDFTLWQESYKTLGVWDAGAQGVGAWTLNVHHAYSRIGNIIYLGDGTQRSTDDIGSAIRTVAGNGISGLNRFSGDGGPAVEAQLNFPRHMAVDAQGNLFIADTQNRCIRKVDTNGVITSIAPQSLRFPTHVAVDTENNLLIADPGHSTIVKVDSNGIPTHFAGIPIGGINFPGFSGDGGPATAAKLNSPAGVAVDAQGNVFIADSGNHRIRKVDPNGTITTVAGNGHLDVRGDGGPATSAQLSAASVAVDAQGNLFIADYENARIRKVSPNGIITTVAGVAGDFPRRGFSGDGGPATAAMLNFPQDVTVDTEGNLFIADVGNRRIRKVSSNGTITTVAGTGERDFGGEGWPAGAAPMNPAGVAVDAQGNLLIADPHNHRIRRVTTLLSQTSDPTVNIVSQDGTELYVFDLTGRHLHTQNALTGALTYQFTYGTHGYLTQIQDGDGNVTIIERDSQGNASAILASDGQRTSLTLDNNGFLATATNPAHETTAMHYTTDGLLTRFINPRGQVSLITYDTLGRLIRDENAAGGSWTLTRTETLNTHEVSMTSALNRQTRYNIESLTTGDKRRTNTRPDSTASTTLEKTDGTTQTTAPDGTLTTTIEGPDPRFGMQAPIPTSLTTKTPGGRTSTVSVNRAVTLAQPNDLLSLMTQTDTVTINGRVGTTVFDTPTRTLTTTSPLSRVMTATLDAQGRVIQATLPSIEPVNNSYDLRGRLNLTTQGSGASQRTTQYRYNPQGFLDTVTDAINRTTRFEYDPIGRVTKQTLPDSRIIQFAYDANGNLTALVPPGRDAHVFRYNAVDLEDEYTPPDLITGRTITQYTYNLDKQLESITRPDGQTIDLAYDSAGRLSQRIVPTGTYQLTYHPTTGQLSTLTAPGGQTLNYSYDGFLPVTESWSGAINGTVTRTYDNNFWLTGLSVNGQSIHFTYDNDGLLLNAGSLTLARNSQNGLLIGTALGFVTTSTNYSPFGELSQDTARLSGIVQYDVTYTRDKLGRITEKLETVQGQTTRYGYTYDLAGRLHQVHHDGMLVSQYDYDANGNRIGGFTPAGIISATYDAQDRLTSYNNAIYTYTTNGELQTKTENNATIRYDYDVLGNLRQVRLPNGPVIDYVIDGQDRRIGKKVNGTLVQGFLYQDQLEPITELDNNGNVVARFVYASHAHSPDYMIKNNETFRIITDHLGSVRLVINTSTGQLAQRIDYDEFGNVLSNTNPGFQPFGFAGGLYDQHTGFVRFGARDYDPRVGRWTAKDPIRFDGELSSLYLYVNSDPINFIDPRGLCNDYWDRYMDHLNEYLINVGPYAAALAGGLWPKSLAPATSGRPPALGSTNPLTSVPRAMGIPGAGSTVVRTSAASIGLATVAIGFYNVGIFASGLAYAAFPGSNGLPIRSSDCTCGG